jgi:hypothetical protein
MWNNIELYAAIPEGREVLAIRPPLAGEDLVTPEGNLLRAQRDYSRTDIRIILKPKPKKRYAVARVGLPEGFSVNNLDSNDSLKFNWRIIEEEQ